MYNINMYTYNKIPLNLKVKGERISKFAAILCIG